MTMKSMPSSVSLCSLYGRAITGYAVFTQIPEPTCFLNIRIHLKENDGDYYLHFLSKQSAPFQSHVSIYTTPFKLSALHSPIDSSPFCIISPETSFKSGSLTEDRQERKIQLIPQSRVTTLSTHQTN